MNDYEINTDSRCLKPLCDEESLPIPSIIADEFDALGRYGENTLMINPRQAIVIVELIEQLDSENISKALRLSDPGLNYFMRQVNIEELIELNTTEKIEYVLKTVLLHEFKHHLDVNKNLKYVSPYPNILQQLINLITAELLVIAVPGAVSHALTEENIIGIAIGALFRMSPWGKQTAERIFGTLNGLIKKQKFSKYLNCEKEQRAVQFAKENIHNPEFKSLIQIKVKEQIFPIIFSIEGPVISLMEDQDR